MKTTPQKSRKTVDIIQRSHITNQNRFLNLPDPDETLESEFNMEGEIGNSTNTEGSTP